MSTDEPSHLVAARMMRYNATRQEPNLGTPQHHTNINLSDFCGTEQHLNHSHQLPMHFRTEKFKANQFKQIFSGQVMSPGVASIDHEIMATTIQHSTNKETGFI